MLHPDSTRALDPKALLPHVRPAPRYTSYPPATEFHGAVGADRAEANLREVAHRTPRAPISLYCHIPYCSALCWYCGCNVVVSRNRDRGREYVDLLIAELRLIADILGARHPLAELALGGGSPNFLPPEELTRLTAAFDACFAIGPDAELGIELDARDTTDEQIDRLAELGYDRFSVGVQDFAAAVQKAIHRDQSVEQTAGLVNRARRRGFRTFNVDLVYGLPAQTPASFAETIDAVVELAPHRIALFGYAHLPHLRPHQKLVERAGPLPDTPMRAQLMATAAQRFADAGYIRIGIDHFARPNDALGRAARTGDLHRNFQGYAIKRADLLIGLGSTGISDTGRAYWQNHADIETWANAIRAGQLPAVRGFELDDEDLLRRHVITRLMCDCEFLDFADVDRRFSLTFEEHFARELAQLGKGEYVELIEIDRDGRKMAGTPLGCNLIRNVCTVFDTYLSARQSGPRPRFSQTF